MTANGSHIAPIFGGLIGQFLGWRWIFKVASIANAVIFLFIVFGLPETLYIRDENAHDRILSSSEKADKSAGSQNGSQKCGVGSRKDESQTCRRPSAWRSHAKRLRMGGRFEGREVKVKNFVVPVVKMAKYVSLYFVPGGPLILIHTLSRLYYFPPFIMPHR